VGGRDARPVAYTVGDACMREMFVFRNMPDPESLPATIPMIEIPFNDDESLLALYLTPHPGMDAIIAARGWRVAPLLKP